MASISYELCKNNKNYEEKLRISVYLFIKRNKLHEKFMEIQEKFKIHIKLS